MKTTLFALIIIGVFAMGLFWNSKGAKADNPDLKAEKPVGYPVATFAGGCFWCLEWEFKELPGVLFIESGYEGGDKENPTYRDVTTGKTGHAEVIEITFDPEKTSYRALVDYFLRKAHDPTQKNRQGVDVGTQYRSAIFYNDDDQKRIAEEAIAAAEQEKVWKNPIVTTIEPSTTFFRAEEYHQDYYDKYKAETGQDHIRVLLKKKKKEAL